jgi:hypothetical protein
LEEGGYVLLEDAGGPAAVLAGGSGVRRLATDYGEGMDGSDECAGVCEIGGLTVDDDDGSVEILCVIEEPMLAGEGAVGHEENAVLAVLDAKDQ